MIIKLFVQRNRTAHNPRIVANLQTNLTIRYILRIEFIFAFLLGCLTFRFGISANISPFIGAGFSKHRTTPAEFLLSVSVPLSLCPFNSY